MHPVGFSRLGCFLGGRFRSFRTDTRRREPPGVALPADARQRRWGMGHKVARKVVVGASASAPL